MAEVSIWYIKKSAQTMCTLLFSLSSILWATKSHYLMKILRGVYENISIRMEVCDNFGVNK